MPHRQRRLLSTVLSWVLFLDQYVRIRSLHDRVDNRQLVRCCLFVCFKAS